MPEIKLTLGDELDTSVVEGLVEAKPVQQGDVQPVYTPEELKMIEEFSQKINIADTNLVFKYGVGVQQNIANFSDSALASVRSKDLGEVGDMISGLVTELRGFSDDDKNQRGGIFGFAKKKVDQLALLKARYDTAEANVTKISNALEEHQVQLLKDAVTLDQLYEMNLTYFKELSMYIEAGKRRLVEVRATDVAAAKRRAELSGLPEDAQAANDLAAKCDRFEKKIYDLELTRNISIQMAPQIRLIQNNDQLMAEKIQTSLVNTIPLWKSQMVLALGLAHSKSALEAQRAVSDITNEMLIKNAELLKTSTIETAKESERGIVDIATLTQTNQTLISTMDEVLKIQREGRQQRLDAEKELMNIEGQLKAKLLEING